MNDNVRLAITMGDPAGVGPETIVQAWREPAFHEQRQLVAIGRPAIFERAVDLLGADIVVQPVDDVSEADSSLNRLPCLAVGDDSADQTSPARIDRRGGQAAYDALVRAADLALEGRIDGLITAPLHKTALAQAGYDYPGHTELLAELCGVKEVAMMLYLPPGERVHGPYGLGVVHVTLHCALKDVFQQLTIARISACAQLAESVLQQLGCESPRVAAAALNPHAGENGLFGTEEQRVIAPAVVQARATGVQLKGPLAADTLMLRAAGGEFDAVVAMYHDQGHIALKLLGMHSAVNITLGLPIVRTSVAHGTAFDLAWQGKAEHRGMLAAADVAAKIARHRKVAGTMRSPVA